MIIAAAFIARNNIESHAYYYNVIKVARNYYSQQQYAYTIRCSVITVILHSTTPLGHRAFAPGECFPR